MVRPFFLLFVLAVSGCATSGAVPQPFPGAIPPSIAPAEPASAPPSVSGAPSPRLGYAVAGTALSLRGVPYRLGGSDPAGFDCSGLVSYVFGRHGLPVPRSVAEQFRAGHEIAPDALEPGDLVFFATKSAGASHVGIAIGGDEFVHAPAANGVVRVERIAGSYWTPRFLGARRITVQP